jgi:hypothetical protein
MGRDPRLVNFKSESSMSIFVSLSPATAYSPAVCQACVDPDFTAWGTAVA